MAYSPTIASVPRTFGDVPPALQLPLPAPSLSPLSNKNPHLRKFPPLLWDWRRSHRINNRYAAYKGSPPTGQLLSSTPSRRTTAGDGQRRYLVMEHPFIGMTGVGLFSPSPVPTPPQQLGMRPRRTAPTPPRIGDAGVGFSSPSPTTPRSSKTRKKKKKKKKTTIGDRHQPWFYDQFSAFTRGTN